MSHIVYITTCMDELDFKDYINHWSISLNPSNQNFHNKLIKSLALTNNVDVISIRPYSKKYCDIKKLTKSNKITANITWHYLSINHNVVLKICSIQNQLNKCIKEFIKDGDIIFCDTINIGAVHATKYLKTKLAKRNVKFVGVVTDSPSNISGVGRSYTKYVLKHCQNYDGYFTLTNELNELYNINNKPYLVSEGLIEERNVEPIFNDNIKYFFFGGALLPRYGIYQLIKAFQEFNKTYPDYYLFIAGHHENKDQLLKAINNNPNIMFKGILPLQTVLQYEAGAVANINPRPYSEDLDRFSIPSKTIEYLASGRPVISCKNSKLAKYFLEEIIWAKSDDPKDLKEALEKAATASDEIKQRYGKLGKEKAFNNFSLKAVNNKISEELLSVLLK